MAIEVNCPRCTRKIRAPDKLAGKKVKCPDCGDVVAVPQATASPRSASPAAASPAAASPAAARPAAKPGKAATGNPPKAAKRPAAAPVRRPAPQSPAPPPMAGVGDLLEEITSLEESRQFEAEEAEYERQQKDAAFQAYMAPMHLARSKQQHSIHSHFADARRLDLGAVIRRAWGVFADEMLMAMLVAWGGFGIFIAGTFLIWRVAALVAGLTGVALLELSGNDIVGQTTAVLIAVAILLGGSVLYIPFGIWLNAGMLKYFVKLARDERPGFVELFLGVRYMPALFGAGFLYLLMCLVPYLPFIALVIMGIFMRPPEFLGWIAWVATLLLYAVMFVWLFRSSFHQYVIVDKGVGSVEGISISSQIMTGNILSVLVLILFMGAMVALGALTLGVGLLFALPFSATLMATAYIDMTGQTPIRRQEE